MTITRDPGFPADIAQLADAFGRCAEGYEINAVLNAAMQTVIHAIVMTVVVNEGTLGQAEKYAEEIGRKIVLGVQGNWQRKPQPTDIQVRPT